MAKLTQCKKMFGRKEITTEPAMGMSMSEETRRQQIALAAYRRAERRGFEMGHELEDWLEAEKEFDAQKS